MKKSLQVILPLLIGGLVGLFIANVCTPSTGSTVSAVTPVPCIEKVPTELEVPAMSLGEAVKTLRATTTESRLLDKYEACLVLVRECVDSCCKE